QEDKQEEEHESEEQEEQQDESEKQEQETGKQEQQEKENFDYVEALIQNWKLATKEEREDFVATCLEEYAQYRPDDWESCYSRGVAFANARRGKQTDVASLRAYNDAIAFAPRMIDDNLRARLFSYRGAILKRLGRLDENESDLSLASKYATAYY